MSLELIPKTLLYHIIGRSESLFAEDIARNKERLLAIIPQSRLLVIGAAGTVGSAFVKQVIPFNPLALDLIDISENGLVEVVRDIRSSGLPVPENFRTLAVDFRNREFIDFLAATPDYDVILNFSALKHVRSERDPYTLMRLLDTNALAVDRLLQFLKTRKTKRFFSVSTDKSVRPANLMGASKSLMEKVMMRHSGDIEVTSARFANVAFSAGSLLEGFVKRMEKGQPISAPNDVRRYFMSFEEAGHLCLLAAFLGENRDVFVPGYENTGESKTFSEIAEAFVRFHGYEPLYCSSDEEALESARQLSEQGEGQAERKWPCHFSPSDTSGEKDLEEFCADTDRVDRERFLMAHIVKSEQPDDVASFDASLQLIDQARLQGDYDLSKLRSLIQDLVPDLEHIDRGRNLDNKM